MPAILTSPAGERHLRYCGQCGTKVSGARFCGQCGAPVEGAFPWTPPGGAKGSEADAFSERQLGALAYVTPVPALAFLLFEPYRRNPFIRFHSYQCLFLTFAAILLGAVTGIISIFHFLEGLLSNALQIALLAMWVLAAYRAWRGDEYRLPVIGAFASRHARG